MTTATMINEALALGLEACDMDKLNVVDDIADACDKVIEVSELYDDVSVTADGLNRLETAAKALDDMIESSIGPATFTPANASDAAVTAIAVESIATIVGLEHVSLESLAETAKAVWEAIKKFINDLIVKIGNFFAAIFTNFEELAKRAERLRIMASKATVDTKGTLSGSSFIKDLAYLGKVDSNSIVSGLDVTNKVVGQCFDAVKACAGKFAEDMARVATRKLEGAVLASMLVHYKNDYDSGHFSGGYRVIPSRSNSNVTIFFEIQRDVTKAKSGETVERATRNQVTRIAGGVKSLCTTVSSKKSIVAQIRKTYETILSKTDTLLKEQGKGGLTRSMSLGPLTSLERLALANYSKTLTDISRVAFTVGRSALLYGEQSLVVPKTKAA